MKNDFLVSNPEDADSIILVDVHNLSWRSYFSPVKDELLDKHGYPSYHYKIALNKIANAVEHASATSRKICIITSADEHPTKKKELFPEYKSDRHPVLKEYNVIYSGKKKVKVVNPVKDTKKVISFLPHCKVWVKTKDEETDDIIATICKKYSDKQIFIMSTDRDLWQLKNKNVHIICSDYPEFVLVSKNQLEKKFNTSDFRLIPLIKTLTGDYSDRLKGVKFFPKKKIIPLIQYSMYKSNIKRGLKNVLKIVSKSVKEKIDNDYDRLVLLHSIIKLNKKLIITEKSISGDLPSLVKFLQKRNIKNPRIIQLWIQGYSKNKT
jgi:5'-3' exonuclease